jgi:hypothetical protein
MRGEGPTRDISASDVFGVASDPVPSGSVLSLQIVLPSLQAQRASGACLCTLGHVVRSEPLGLRWSPTRNSSCTFPRSRPQEIRVENRATATMTQPLEP